MSSPEATHFVKLSQLPIDQLPHGLRLAAASKYMSGEHAEGDTLGHAADQIERLHKFKERTHGLLDELRVPQYNGTTGCRIQKRIEHLSVYGLPGAVWVHITNIRKALIAGLLLGTVIGVIGHSALQYYWR